VTVNLLLVEDNTPEIPGVLEFLQGGFAEIRVFERVLTTFDDSIEFFLGAAERAALGRIPIDGVLIDGYLPRVRGASAEFVAIELAIRITELYQQAGIAKPRRPRLILRTAGPDPCDVVAFIAYGGSGYIAKEHTSPDKLRSEVLEVVAHRRPWEPSPPTRALHGYRPGDWRYLAELERDGGNRELARRMGFAEDTISDAKERLRTAFGLPPRATNAQIVQAAKVANVLWIPLKWQRLAEQHAVKAATHVIARVLPGAGLDGDA